MKLEVRTSGDEAPVCGECGSTELLWAGGAPLSADLTGVMEREIVRREIGLAKVLRDHLKAAAADTARRETRMALALADERWALRQEHHALVEEIAGLLEATKVVDVPAWRVCRRKQERVFAERIDAVTKELIDRTRLPFDNPVQVEA